MIAKYPDFTSTYLTLKKEGKKFFGEKEVNAQLLDWIKNNIPKTKETAPIWSGR